MAAFDYILLNREQMLEPFKIKQNCLYIFEKKDDEWEMLLENCDEHLEK